MTPMIRGNGPSLWGRRPPAEGNMTPMIRGEIERERQSETKRERETEKGTTE